MLVNESLKICRELRGITQVKLAEKLGISQQFIEQMEKGERQIPLDRFLQIADCLQCSLEELAGRTTKEE